MTTEPRAALEPSTAHLADVDATELAERHEARRAANHELSERLGRALLDE